MGSIANSKEVQFKRKGAKKNGSYNGIPIDEFGLTAKQRRFCDHMLADPEENRKAAYQKAGYKGADKNVSMAASRLMQNKTVRAYLYMRRQRLRRNSQIKEQHLLDELSCIAFFDPADLFDEDGRLRLIHEIPQAARKAIAQLDVFTEYEGRGSNRIAVGTTTRVKFVDKKGAIDSLARILGLFQQDKIDTDGVAKLMDLVAQSRGGSTIGRLNTINTGGGPVRGSELAVEQPVFDSGQERSAGPLPMQLGARGTAPKLLVHERDLEGSSVGDDDVS
jgi:phage terminase small subunit